MLKVRKDSFGERTQFNFANIFICPGRLSKKLLLSLFHQTQSSAAKQNTSYKISHPCPCLWGFYYHCPLTMFPHIIGVSNAQFTEKIKRIIKTYFKSMYNTKIIKSFKKQFFATPIGDIYLS